MRAGGDFHVSGLVGIDPSTGEPAGAGIQDQTHQALRNCRAVLVSIRMTAVTA